MRLSKYSGSLAGYLIFSVIGYARAKRFSRRAESAFTEDSEISAFGAGVEVGVADGVVSFLGRAMRDWR